jgi:sec-independent protein translocase protein TatA
MESVAIGHWLFVLAFVLLVVAARKLRDLGTDLVCGMRGFKDAMRKGTEKKEP